MIHSAMNKVKFTIRETDKKNKKENEYLLS